MTVLLPREEELLDLSAAAAVIGMTIEGVAKKVRSGRLPAQRIGHKWFLRREDVEAVAEARPPVGCLDQVGVAYPVIVTLAQEKDHATVEQLAELVSRPRRTVLGWLQRLDREGLVTRRRGPHPRDPDQGRLTDAGWALYREELAMREALDKA